MADLKEISVNSILIFSLNKKDSKEVLEKKIKQFLKTDDLSLYDYIEKDNKLFIIKNDIKNIFHRDKRLTVSMIYTYSKIATFLDKKDKNKEGKSALFFSFINNKLYVFKITDYSIELLLESQNDLSVFISIYNKYKELDYYYFYEDMRILQDNIKLLINILGLSEKEKANFIAIDLNIDEIYTNSKKYNFLFRDLKDLFKSNIEIFLFNKDSKNEMFLNFFNNFKNNFSEKIKDKKFLTTKVLPFFLIIVLGGIAFFFYNKNNQDEELENIAPITNIRPQLSLQERINKLKKEELAKQFIIYNNLKTYFANVKNSNLIEFSLLKDKKNAYMNVLYKGNKKELNKFKKLNLISSIYKINDQYLFLAKKSIKLRLNKKMTLSKIETDPNFIEYEQFLFSLDDFKSKELDKIKKIADFMYLYNFTGNLNEINKKILLLSKIKNYFVNIKITKLDDNNYMLIGILYMDPKIYKIIYKNKKGF